LNVTYKVWHDGRFVKVGYRTGVSNRTTFYIRHGHAIVVRAVNGKAYSVTHTIE